MTYETYKNKKKKEHRNWRIGRNRSGKSYANFRSREFSLCEKMFWLYNMIKDEVSTIRAEQGYYQSGRKEGGGSSNHAFISDPTYQLASKHMQLINSIVLYAGGREEIIKRPEDWIKVVEQTMKYFDSTSYVHEVLKRRYFKNENKNKTIIILELTSDDAYYKLRDEGIIYARECAIQLGLIKVFDDDAQNKI